MEMSSGSIDCSKGSSKVMEDLIPSSDNVMNSGQSQTLFPSDSSMSSHSFTNSNVNRLVADVNDLHLNTLSLTPNQKDVIIQEYAKFIYSTIQNENYFKEKGIEPLISITERKITGSLDKSALLRIFANILSNALKYSDGDLEIILNDSGKIIFTNTATGLDEIQVGKIFDRFYTVENARTSTGLGLSIARSLAECMGGKISASYGNKKLSINVDFGAKNARESHA